MPIRPRLPLRSALAARQLRVHPIFLCKIDHGMHCVRLAFIHGGSPGHHIATALSDRIERFLQYAFTLSGVPVSRRPAGHFPPIPILSPIACLTLTRSVRSKSQKPGLREILQVFDARVVTSFAEDGDDALQQGQV
jgi:hypothetical protein